jgi:murein DD-endopeptidase MepM/ murein hydrolase activator NlpD
MSPENVHDRKEKRRFTLVVVPSGESEKTRTFSVSKWGIIAAFSASFFVIIALIVVVLVYTPLRSLMPVSNSELEKRYGRQIVGIQEQVNELLQEMVVLRGYNLRLRKALGESISGEDSSVIAMGESQKMTKPAMPSKNPQPDVNDASSLMDEMTPQAGSSALSILLREGDDRTMAAAATIDLPLTMPTTGYITRGFDPKQFHFGIDFAGKRASPVFAAADGNVVFAGWTYDDGYMMMIAHDRGYITVYKHNEALVKTTGANVKRGEMIATLGNTGKTSSGPHLHFEVWNNGMAYNPQQFLLIAQ